MGDFSHTLLKSILKSFVECIKNASMFLRMKPDEYTKALSAFEAAISGLHLGSTITGLSKKPRRVTHKQSMSITKYIDNRTNPAMYEPVTGTALLHFKELVEGYHIYSIPGDYLIDSYTSADGRSSDEWPSELRSLDIYRKKNA